MSKSNVTAWKEGRIPSLYTVMRIAKHLNVPVTRLIPKE
nr:MAG TPA: SOS-response transcriptional repressor [Caudoviricetes sp.]